MVKAWLEIRPNPNRQMRERRRNKFGFTGVTGVMVIHTAESPADVKGPDSGTTNVANFISTRKGETNKGSYHSLADSDSRLRVVPFNMTAYGAGTPTGVNDYALHFSVAASAAQWKTLPQDWKDGAIHQLALEIMDGIKYVFKTRGVKVPITRISRAQVDAGKPGLVSHGELDPGRRTDPGKDFPWDYLIRVLTAMVKEWNWGKVDPKPKPKPPAPKPGKPQPSKPKPKPTGFATTVGTANLRNFPDMSRAQVKGDARLLTMIAGGLGAFQEIYENEDWLDVRAAMPAHISVTSNPTGEDAPQRRECTSYFNTKVYDFVREETLDLPGDSKTTGANRYAKVLHLRVKSTGHKVVFVNYHLLQGAWGKDPNLANRTRKQLWTQQWTTIIALVSRLLAQGCIVIIVGDGNRQTRDVPTHGGRLILGGEKAIDQGYVWVPKGVTVKVGTELTRDINSDHHARAVRLAFNGVPS